jgi:hypothetical protein
MMSIKRNLHIIICRRMLLFESEMQAVAAAGKGRDMRAQVNVIRNKKINST